MYRVAFAALLAACSFRPAPLAGDAAGPGSDGPRSNGSDGMDGPGDAACVEWEFTPTNFEPCAIAATSVGLDVTTATALDPAMEPMTTVMQPDGTQIAVIHLTSLTVEPAGILTIPEIPGVAGVVFAVEGDASIQGTIVALAGADDPMHCASATGKNGANSGNSNDGGGGGGGGAAADDGGDGGDGAGGMKGAKGGKGAKINGATSLSPLRGGCAGGAGGLVQGSSDTAAVPGHGGGALEISARGTITVAGLLDANGHGGGGGAAADDGGAGGGGGGGILLEAPTVTVEVTAHVCADGGSGGEGGGVTVPGNSGNAGACTGAGYATTPSSGSYGGLGGHGSYSESTKGGAGGAGTAGAPGFGNGAGGGGGGGVGWIRIHSPTPTTGGVITPTPLVD